MLTNALQGDIARFEDIVRNLSMGINHSGVAWRDAQYAELAQQIQSLAASSREVVMAGNRCAAAIRQFESIANEE